MTPGRLIRILIADEHALFREAVKSVLDARDDFSVVAEAADSSTTIELAERSAPDVVVLDESLAGYGRHSVIEALREKVPECHVLVMTEREGVRGLVSAVEAGATGYMSKRSPLVDLITAAQQLQDGYTVVPRNMLGPLLDRLLRREKEHDEVRERILRLSSREKEVLALLAQGAQNSVIGERLFISPQTARTHIQNILAKLGVHSRLEAAAFVLRNDLLKEMAPRGETTRSDRC